MEDLIFFCFLQDLREKRGFTVTQLAQTAGVSVQSVIQWEKGLNKPPIHTLEKVALALNVRVDELIESRLKRDVSQEEITRICDHYEQTRRVISYDSTGVKFKRCVAFLLDALFFSLAISLLSFPSLILSNERDSIFSFGSYFLFVFSLILRDLIFSGVSLGKRIMGLEILEYHTAQKAKRFKTLIRNLFLPLVWLDFFVILIQGRSMGDCAARTVVVNKKNIDYSYNISGNTKVWYSNTPQ